MTISAVDLFSIGIGPSSSHTVGPMRAAQMYVATCPTFPAHVTITLRGSLAATGRGHGTDRASLLGLIGWTPLTATKDLEPHYGEQIPISGRLTGPAGTLTYALVYDFKPVPEHPNCIIFQGFDKDHAPLTEPTEYFSVGGGFIVTRPEIEARISAHSAERSNAEAPLGMAAAITDEPTVPFAFTTWSDLAELARRTGLTIAELMLRNEEAIHQDADQCPNHLDQVWTTMQDCVAAGLSADGILPGGLNVPRRAPDLLDKLKNVDGESAEDPLRVMDWINLYALAVNEENAAGGRVVTAPTNGAAGIIPSVMHYARDFVGSFTPDRAREFLLTAAAIGIIIKEGASISGAEVGCQGEVGSASAMAAAGLCAIRGGSVEQIGNAAEIALEHNLGLTCDPVGGLVQIPCIERNAIGGVKSVNAARLALNGNGDHQVSLDIAVETMARTGHDMLSKYKETSMGGLAVALGLPVSQTEC